MYYVDPGINGAIRKLPNGSDVPKFDAPKATLMSYIIKGILGGELPWGLVLLGVMIAVVLEMSGIPSLAFAVGVYLPLSSSTPILAGGLVRWAVDRQLRKKLAHKKLTEEELVVAWKLRRVLSGLETQQSLELLTNKIRETQSNVEFLMQVQKTTPAVNGRDSD